MRVGPYEVLDELGRGGMGVVFRVRGPSGEAALKVLHRADPAAFARFERERRLLGAFGEEHGFVGLLDAGSSPEAAWLVMPFVPGGTLRARLEAGPLGVEETVALGIALGTALGAAHERGIVHRDVKPENVLFTAEGRPLLADLGLGKHFDRSAPGASQSLSLTATGAMRGTAGYMAPEQLTDAASVGPPADVFALGAVLYECLSGLPAFEGETPFELCRKVGSGVFEPLGRDVPRWLADTVTKALAVEIRDRFPDGTSLARALSLRGASARAKRGNVAPFVLGAALGALALAGALAGARATRTGSRPEAHASAPPSAPPARPPTPPGNAAAREQVERADEKFKAGDMKGAIDALTRAIELDPRLAGAWYRRGMARGTLRDWDGAVSDLTKALELDPGYVPAWRDRGRARDHVGDVEGALSDLTRAIELDPGSAMAHCNRGVVRAEKRDFAGAVDDETKAIELDPTLALAWYHRGVARGEMKDPRGAIDDLSKAIELDATLTRAWSDRGYLRAQQRDWEGVIADETRAIELEPALPAPWVRRAQARREREDFAGVVSDLERYLALVPDPPPQVRALLDEARAKAR